MAKRVDLDVRPIGPWRKNEDYGDGLYFGKMDKYKSVKDFIDKKRKRKRALRKKAWIILLSQIISS